MSWGSRDWRPGVVVQFGIIGGRPAIVKLWLDLDKLNTISLGSDSSWASFPALQASGCTVVCETLSRSFARVGVN